MFNKDNKNKELFERFYSDLYFRTTKELVIKRSVLKSKMTRSNSLTIILSLMTVFFSFSVSYINLIKEVLQTTTEIAPMTALIILIGVFVGVFISLAIESVKEEYKLSQKKKMLIMTEVIDLILSEREK